jgi:hypothetical protein
MLAVKTRPNYVYVYVVDRDFGFAPNPFHGRCTLATCKPIIRRNARIGDWVVGMGGKRLGATGRCVFAMRVTTIVTFEVYWNSLEYFDKKPVRNGSQKMQVGDNIYSRDKTVDGWHQHDSHHSNADGTPNMSNLEKDTDANAVLISDHFYYFGRSAPLVPKDIVTSLGFKNRRSHNKYDVNGPVIDLIRWLDDGQRTNRNRVAADPFDFGDSSARYSDATNKIIR